jgi:hypothetical protein
MGEEKYSTTHSIPQPYMEVSGQLQDSGHLTLRERTPGTQKCGTHSQSECCSVQKNSCPCQKPNHHSSFIQPLALSLQQLPILAPNTNCREGKFKSLTPRWCTLNTHDTVWVEVYMWITVSFWNSVTSCESNWSGVQKGTLCATCRGSGRGWDMSACRSQPRNGAMSPPHNVMFQSEQLVNKSFHEPRKPAAKTLVISHTIYGNEAFKKSAVHNLYNLFRNSQESSANECSTRPASSRNDKNVAKSLQNCDTFFVCHEGTDSRQNWHLVQTGSEHSERRSISVVSVCLSVRNLCHVF